MRKKILAVVWLLALVTGLLSGCFIKTVDQLYQLPLRSEDYNKLQSAISTAMAGLEYCAPTQGENQQSVQLVDLTGDGFSEAVLFARGNDEKPLKMFVFALMDDVYTQIARMEFSGTSFEQVEYSQIDGKPGQELVVGRQMGKEVLHALSAYSFADGQPEPILTAGYTRYLTFDLDSDGLQDVFVLRPGSDGGTGVAELYHFRENAMERLSEAGMSVPVESIKRIAAGGMDPDTQAVFVASKYEENTIITDVYAATEDRLINVSLSSESGTSVKTIRNYYVYGDDIDDDGLIELPALVREEEEGQTVRQDFIRWYNLTPEGQETHKIFTYHNYAERWYIRLQDAWDDDIQVSLGNPRGGVQGYVFSVQGAELFTVYAFTGTDRDTLAESGHGFLLNKTDEVTYGAVLGPGAAQVGLTREKLVEDFNFIRYDWKTGET